VNHAHTGRPQCSSLRSSLFCIGISPPLLNANFPDFTIIAGISPYGGEFSADACLNRNNPYDCDTKQRTKTAKKAREIRTA
jgi:hypothetical protein